MVKSSTPDAVWIIDCLSYRSNAIDKTHAKAVLQPTPYAVVYDARPENVE